MDTMNGKKQILLSRGTDCKATQPCRDAICNIGQEKTAVVQEQP